MRERRAFGLGGGLGLACAVLMGAGRASAQGEWAADIITGTNMVRQTSASGTNYFMGKVVIGTNTPEFRLTLDNDGGIIARGTYGAGASLVTTGRGARLIWYPKKAALRAGTVNSNEWDHSQIGDISVAFGSNNVASGLESVVAGGACNTALSAASSVGGGWGNTASGTCASVAGGMSNKANGVYTAVGGGFANSALASAFYGSVVAGGCSNTATGWGATVGGGLRNTASATYATVIGGSDNTASAGSSTVLGGQSNVASATYCVAAGFRATASNNYTFVWSDGSRGAFASTGTNQFLVSAAGGVGIGTNKPLALLHVAGNGWFDQGVTYAKPLGNLSMGAYTAAP